MLDVGQKFEKTIAVTQEEINQFAQVSGDTNPIHIDPEFAKNTRFKSTIAHGIWVGTVFSKYLGTEFPGAGSIYLSQTLQFKRPVFPGKSYKLIFEITETNLKRNTATVKTSFFDAKTNKICVDGEASLMFPEK